MTKVKYECEFCMKCGEKANEGKEACTCGSNNVIYGSNFTYDKKAVCGCGCDKFKKVSHMNCNPYYHNTYQCSSCGNLIGTQTYYQSPYVD